MRILAIDTSSKAASAAIIEDGKILASSAINDDKTHSQKIMVLINHVLKAADIKLKDLDALAVSKGPGSFTGIRIGISTLMGLAKPSGTKLIGVSTLQALARNNASFDGLIVPVMDAKRNQVYTAIFESSGGKINRLTQDMAISVNQLIELLEKDGRKVILNGDGAGKFFGELSKTLDVRLSDALRMNQSAQSVAYEAMFEQAKDSISLNYIRESQAVEDRKAK